MQGKRRWVGLRVWVADADGKRRSGTLWWGDDTSALIREDGVLGLQVLPKAAQGTRWGFAENNDKK
jgi:hypothetical protein